jgi:hypothetical protein
MDEINFSPSSAGSCSSIAASSFESIIIHLKSCKYLIKLLSHQMSRLIIYVM